MPTTLATLLVPAILAVAPVAPTAAVAPAPGDRAAPPAAVAPAGAERAAPPLQDRPGGDTGGEASLSAAARNHYAARRYREAAQLYEQLWRTSKAPKYLFNAGMARAAAEQDGAAIVHWQAYLAAAPNVSAKERSMLASEIAAARKRTRPITLRVQGPLAPATLTLTAPDGAPQGPRDPLELIPAATLDLSLETGDWIATLHRPDRPDSVARFNVAADAEPVITLGAEPPPPLPTPEPPPPPEPVPPAPAELTLHLGPARALTRGATVGLIGPESRTPRHVRDATTSYPLPPGEWSVRVDSRDRDPATATTTLAPGERRSLRLHLRPDLAARTRLGLGLGLGGAGLVFLTAGAVVTARAPHRSLQCLDAASCSAAADAVLDRSIGFSLIGTGLGAAVPALTAGLVRDRPGDLALLVEAGVGAVLLAGGAGWYLGEVTRTTALDHRPRQHAAAVMRGLGGGMLGGAVIALVVRRLTRGKAPPLTFAPTVTRHSRGFALQANF